MISGRCENKNDPSVANNAGNNCVCYKIYAPVCGCDGFTYSNGCHAECIGITQYTAGECKEPGEGEAIHDCICTMEYDPVCGCDNITYSNACSAECAKLSIYSEGECP